LKDRTAIIFCIGRELLGLREQPEAATADLRARIEVESGG
jgi:hypothetical protein